MASFGVGSGFGLAVGQWGFVIEQCAGILIAIGLFFSFFFLGGGGLFLVVF